MLATGPMCVFNTRNVAMAQPVESYCIFIVNKLCTKNVENCQNGVTCQSNYSSIVNKQCARTLMNVAMVQPVNQTIGRL